VGVTRGDVPLKSSGGKWGIGHPTLEPPWAFDPLDFSKYLMIQRSPPLSSSPAVE
jgi:hypothetical protein